MLRIDGDALEVIVTIGVTEAFSVQPEWLGSREDIEVKSLPHSGRRADQGFSAGARPKRRQERDLFLRVKVELKYFTLKYVWMLRKNLISPWEARSQP
jgi:hypothetical protein